jgi:hypothetical protein
VKYKKEGKNMFDLNEMFNWDSAKDNASMNLTKEKKVYDKDSRFYVLPKNEKKEGVAIIRLLPDAEGQKFTAMQKIATTINQNGQKRFVNDWSPASCGLPCPFQERWAELWNADRKDESRAFSRSIRYVVNIKVIKDPLKPENEGKIFLYEISGSLKDKFQAALQPSESDLAIGTKPKQLFNPLKGSNIKLVAKIGANGQTNYDSTEVMAEETAIYSNSEEAIKDIKENSYLISKEMLSPTNFKSYEELKKDLEWVTFEDVNKNSVTSSGTPSVSVAERVQSQAPVEINTASAASTSAANDELDSLLAGLL